MKHPPSIERAIDDATDALYADLLPKVEADGPLDDEARREFRADLRRKIFEPLARKARQMVMLKLAATNTVPH